MRYRGYLTSAALLFALAGCSTVTEEGYRQKVNGMIGLSAEAVEAEWGLPYGKAPMSDGSEMWAYRRGYAQHYGDSVRIVDTSTTTKYKDDKGVEHKETRTTSKPEYSPPRADWLYCETRFVVSPAQLVTNVTFDGNDCKAEEKGTPSRTLPNDKTPDSKEAS